MKPWLIAGIAASVIIALGGFLLHGYGKARYEAGVADCRANVATDQAAAVDQALKDKNRISEYEKNLQDDGLDAVLDSLGILRPEGR